MQPTKPRILYVKDHKDTREFVSLLLDRSNYEVAAMESGIAAIPV